MLARIKRKAHSRLRLIGRAIAEEHDVETGKLLSTQTIDNMVVNAGKTEIAAWISQSSSDFASHMAFSTSATAIQLTDTTLSGEVTRVALGSTTDAAGVVTFKAMLGKNDGNGSTYASVALFNDPTTGTMLSAFVLAATVEKDNSKSLTITYTWTLADA